MEKKKMTRGTKKLVEDAISQLEPSKKNNTNAICEKMVEMLVDRFDGANLDYQLKRMDLETTGRIIEKIDEYFQKHPNLLYEETDSQELATT